MKLGNIQDDLGNLDLSKKQAKSVLSLIDQKIDNDMKDVINKMDIQFSNVNAKFDSFNSELKRVEDKMDTKFTMIIWAIGLLIALIVGLFFKNMF